MPTKLPFLVSLLSEITSLIRSSHHSELIFAFEEYLRIQTFYFEVVAHLFQFSIFRLD